MMIDYDLDTPRYLAHGITVFQACLVNESEFKTVELIHEKINPFDDALIMDFGCGVAGVPRYMLDINPTLKFLCVSNSKFQTDYIRDLNHKSIAPINCDFSNVPLPNNSIDFAMFNESIGYGDIYKSLLECFRLLKSGGRVVIKDFLNKGDEELTQMFFDVWGYRIHLPEYMALAAQHAGFEIIEIRVINEATNKKYGEFIKQDPYMRAKYTSYTPDMIARAGDSELLSKSLIMVLQK
jgi:ubiquinone/menaquinone biosynthesis C-methylase UbiE